MRFKYDSFAYRMRSEAYMKRSANETRKCDETYMKLLFDAQMKRTCVTNDLRMNRIWDLQRHHPLLALTLR